MIIDFLANYYENVEKYPVRSQVEPGYLRKRLPESAPYNSESIETILQDVTNDIIPGLTHWQSPNYFAYFPSSVPDLILSASIFNWMSSPATTELERGGVLQGTTCEAILCTLTAARNKMLNKFGRESINKLVVYASDQTHCALQKAAQISGINCCICNTEKC
ncbi:hypothetical protein MKX01_016383 [Papaver californicum]|nr:hypothetical protein MKX01_016383 [Papaver californicum]